MNELNNNTYIAMNELNNNTYIAMNELNNKQSITFYQSARDSFKNFHEKDENHIILKMYNISDFILFLSKISVTIITLIITYISNFEIKNVILFFNNKFKNLLI